jgi:hypothetical protein
VNVKSRHHGLIIALHLGVTAVDKAKRSDEPVAPTRAVLVRPFVMACPFPGDGLRHSHSLSVRPDLRRPAFGVNSAKPRAFQDGVAPPAN